MPLQMLSTAADRNPQRTQCPPLLGQHRARRASKRVWSRHPMLDQGENRSPACLSPISHGCLPGSHGVSPKSHHPAIHSRVQEWKPVCLVCMGSLRDGSEVTAEPYSPLTGDLGNAGTGEDLSPNPACPGPRTEPLLLRISGIKAPSGLSSRPGQFRRSVNPPPQTHTGHLWKLRPRKLQGCETWGSLTPSCPAPVGVLHPL